MTVFDELMGFTRETQALASVAGRTGWDQETMMPKGASALRGEEMAALEAVLHGRRCDPRVGDWLEAAVAPDETGAAQIRHIRRSYERATKVPAKLAVELAKITSLSQGEWAAARAADDWPAFRGRLAEIVALKREEAAALSSGAAYDALLQDYEPGSSEAEIAALFDTMRPRLVALREKLLGADTPKGLSGTFPEAGQMALAADLAQVFGYDLTRGRLDKAVHPFSSGSGTDVRITTRTNPDDPFDCIYSTIHEVGHATYEQQIDPSYILTPLGSGASMGVHESQSRIYENQLGRGRAFTGWLYGQMRDRFGDIGVTDPEAFYAAVNAVHPGFIRTEADEVHYNLHIMLRFDLEREVIAGRLEVADLEDAWNHRFKADFGVTVDRPSNGVLQDVHWPVGLFGYFPTYSLGNVYAGCLFDALQRDLPGLQGNLSQGELRPALDWLAEALQRHGGLYEPRDTIRQAIGAEPTAEPLLSYLEAKFGDLYGV